MSWASVNADKLCKNDLLWHNCVMSLLELQHQAELLPLHERAALIRHLQQTLTLIELDTLRLEETKIRLSKLQNSGGKHQSWVGIGASGIGDLSERVDELLFADHPLEHQR
jgi:hypothetical protein